MMCDWCGTAFTPSPENPGVTQVGGYADETRIEHVYLCDADVSRFYALAADEQHAAVGWMLAGRQTRVEMA